MIIVHGKHGRHQSVIREVDRAPVKPVRVGELTLEALDKVVTAGLTSAGESVSVSTPGGHEARDAR